MHRDGKKFTVESHDEGKYLSVAVARILDDKGLRKHGVFIDMFTASEATHENWQEVTLDEDDAEVAFQALRSAARHEDPLEGPIVGARHRMTALHYLNKLDLLHVYSFGAIEE